MAERGGSSLTLDPIVVGDGPDTEETGRTERRGEGSREALGSLARELAADPGEGEDRTQGSAPINSLARELSSDDDVVAPMAGGSRGQRPPQQREEEFANISEPIRPDRDTRPESTLNKVLAFADRPRAANAGALISLSKGGGLEEAGKAWMRGIQGEDHPLMSDLVFDVTQVARGHMEMGDAPSIRPVVESYQRLFSTGVRVETPEGETRSPFSLFTKGVGLNFLTGDRLALYERDTAKVDAFIATTMGIGMDLAIDPLSWSGIGITKRGVTTRAAQAAQESGQPMSREFAERLIEMEQRGDMTQWADTIAERLRQGQERMWVGAIPVPGKVSGAAVGTISQFIDMGKKLPLMTNLGRAFSTRFGLEGPLSRFKDLEDNLRGALALGKESAVLEGAAFNRRVSEISKQLTRETGVTFPTEVVGRTVTDLVENIKLSAAMKRTDYDEMISTMNFTDDLVEKTFMGVGRNRIRTENLDENVRALIGSNPEVQKLARTLRDKNDAQFAAEVASGIRLTKMGDNTRTIHRLQQALDNAPTGARQIRNPITGRMQATSTIRKRIQESQDSMRKQQDLDYFVHSLTPQARKVVEGRGKRRGRPGSTSYEHTANHLSAQHRKFEGKTIEEINRLAREGALPGYEGIRFKNGFFQDNPAFAQAVRDMRHRGTMSVVRFADDTKRQFGTYIDDTLSEGVRAEVRQLRDAANRADSVGDATAINPLTGREVQVSSLRQSIQRRIDKDADIPPGMEMSQNPLTEGYLFPREIRARIDAHYDAMLNPTSNGMFIDMYDQAQGWWKAWTLGIFPAYHSRNAVGNMWNNFVTGTNNPLVYKSAAELQQGQAGRIRTVDGREIDFDVIRDQLDNLGIKNRGFIGTDMEITLRNELGEGRWMSLSRDSQVLYYANRYGRAVENNARIAKFIDEVQKGADFQTAANNTRHALFDYSDLTQFEQQVAKRLMPFYTWSRKNIPLQAQAMLQRPGRYKAYDTVMQNIEANTEDPGEYALAGWMLENVPTRVRIDPEDGMPRYLMHGNLIPAADIMKMANDLDQIIKGDRILPRLFTDLLSPIVKTPAEQAFNFDMFTQQEIQSYPGQRNSFLGDSVEINPRVAHILRNIRALTTLDSMLPDEYRGLVPSNVRDQTPEEMLLHFMTGVRLYGVDIQQQRQFRQQELEREGARYQQEMMRELVFSETAERDLNRFYGRRRVHNLKSLLFDNQIEQINTILGHPAYSNRQKREFVDNIVGEQEGYMDYLKRLLSGKERPYETDPNDLEPMP